MSDRDASPSDLAGPRLVLIVRHGATEWSTQGRHTGRTDVPLTGAGRDQADRLPALLNAVLQQAGDAGDPLVFTSPLQRASATAQRALPRAGATVVDALAEIDYGNYEGLTTAEIHDRRPGWDLFTDGCPGGESPAQVFARCEAFVAKLERTAHDRTVIAFTHGHLGRVLACRLLGWPGQHASGLHSDTASVGVIARRHGRMVMRAWNLRS